MTLSLLEVLALTKSKSLTVIASSSLATAFTTCQELASPPTSATVARCLPLVVVMESFVSSMSPRNAELDLQQVEEMVLAEQYMSL